MRAIHTAQGINQSICKASQFWMYNFTDKENAVQLNFCHRNKNPPHTQVQVTIYAIGHLNGSCELGLLPRIFSFRATITGLGSFGFGIAMKRDDAF